MAGKFADPLRTSRRQPSHLHRRDFLRLTSLGMLAALGAPACATTYQHPFGGPGYRTAQSQRVLIIGAGISGLAAARALADIGHDVLIIESRNRIGGRIQTSNQWADAPMDLGASWIHGTTNNPIAQIATQIGAQTVATNGASELYGSSGAVLTTAQYNRLMQLQSQAQQIVAKGQNAGMDRSLRQTVETGIGFDQLSPQDQRFVNFIINEVEQEAAGSASSLSTYWFDDPGFFNGNDVVFPAGYSAITNHLSTGLAVELGRTVSAIAVDSSGVTVTTQQGTFFGDRAVVTLPLGVLKAGTVQFSPGLPSSMQQAINTLQMGVLNKTILRFPSIFWPQNLDWLQQVPQNHGEWLNWLSFSRVLGQPILGGFNVADFGQQIEAWTDQEIVASGMARLRSIFGNGIPDPIDFQITRWASDPHTRGSYSYLPVGADPAMRDALAGNIHNRVYFAGEATNRQYYPTVHGAYLSGIAAAGKVELAAGPVFADSFETGDTTRWALTNP